MKQLLTIALAAQLAYLSCPQQSLAQFGGSRFGGGGSREDWAKRMEQFRSMRGGGDSGGSREDWAKRMEQFRSMRGGGDSGSSREDWAKRIEEWRKSRGGDSSSRSGGREGGRSRGSSSKEIQRRKQIQVTVDLPEDYMEGDRDRDGQIGLYEWKEWKSRAAISMFFRLDRNRDGFLTPRELVYAQAGDTDTGSSTEESSASASSTESGSSSESESASTSEKSSTASSSTETKSTESASNSGSAASSASAKLAAKYFPLLDRDKSGMIEGKEWERSRRLRPMFEKIGADLSKPMSKEDFIATYIKANTK